MAWGVHELPGDAVAVLTDRHGGVSAAPFDTANLSTQVGDDPRAVAENQRRVAVGAGIPRGWVRCRQVHGAEVIVATGGAPAVPGGAEPTGDALVSDRRGVALAVVTADCAPIALASEHGAGAVHAGWRGLERGVVGAAVDALRRFGDGPVTAVLGPCIHPEHYEFGADELTRLALRFGPDVVAATRDGAPAFDVPAAVRIALADAGVDSVTDVAIDTFTSPDHYSHRRDGRTGRQALVVVRR